MKQATISTLKNQLSRYLRIVKRGEVVRVLERGIAVAEIQPLSHRGAASDDRLQLLENKGIIRRGNPKKLSRFVVAEGGKTGILESLLNERRSGR